MSTHHHRADAPTPKAAAVALGVVPPPPGFWPGRDPAAGDLFTATREHDLPPRWDGRTVTWEPWRAPADMFVCPPARGRGRDRCTRCGSTAAQALTAGIVHPLPGDTVATDRVRRTSRTGREYVSGTMAVPAWPVIRLHAFRCPHCLHDTVWDCEQDQWWDLDPGDYGPDGSTDPADGEESGAGPATGDTEITVRGPGELAWGVARELAAAAAAARGGVLGGLGDVRGGAAAAAHRGRGAGAGVLGRGRGAGRGGAGRPGAVGGGAGAPGGSAGPGPGAFERFARSNIALVYFWARRDWRARDTGGLDVEDLAAAGFSGLVTAIYRWDYRRGLKFSTYGTAWVRQCMQREVRRCRDMTLTAADEAALEELFRARFHLEVQLGRPARVGELAEALTTSRAAVRDLLTLAAHGRSCARLDAPLREGEGETLGDRLAATVPDPAEELTAGQDRAVLQAALSRLSARQRAVVTARVGWDGPPRSEEDLAACFGVSPARVRAVCLEGLAALRRALQDQAGVAA